MTARPESHADFIQSYANRTLHAATLPGPTEAKAAFGAFALPYLVRTKFARQWCFSVIGWENDKLPLACGCVQEPRTSIEVAVVRIENLIRNTPGWTTLLGDANAVAKWHHDAEQYGLAKLPLLRTSWQPDPAAVLALEYNGFFTYGVANGPLIYVAKPQTSRMHYIPVVQVPDAPISDADFSRLFEEASYWGEPDIEKDLEARKRPTVTQDDVQRMRKRAVDSAQQEIAHDLENRQSIMDKAEALCDDQKKTTFQEIFDYALEECMDDAKNMPTRFGTYAVHFHDGLIQSATEKTLQSLAAALLESKSKDQTYRPRRELYNDERDWLPQLDAVVDLIIHPSHYSLVSNVTSGYDRGKSIGRSWEDFTSDEEASSRETIALPFVDDEDRIYHRSDKFQWLPSEFHLATGSDLASFSSYINNLNPARNCQHYDAIGMVLGQLVPLFEHVLTDLQSPRHPIIDWECKDHYRLPKDASDQVRKHFHELMKLTDSAWVYCDWQNLALNFPTLPRYQGHPAPSATWPCISLRDRQLQVIVKKTMALLTPSKPDQPAGMWHIEGLEHERVVAVGVYCLDVENVSTPSLGLRSAVGNPQRYKGEDAAIMAAFGMVDQDPRNQYWGDLHLLPGRCAAFSNVYQHRFSAVSLLDRSRNGHSTLVCFLLMDPTTRITSTLQIPPQQSDWTKLDNDALVEQQAEERLYLTRNLDLFEDSVRVHSGG